MPADIVRICVRLTNGHEFVNITCTVVEKLNYSLILGSDLVDKLNIKLVDEGFGLKNVMSVCMMRMMMMLMMMRMRMVMSLLITVTVLIMKTRLL